MKYVNQGQRVQWKTRTGTVYGVVADAAGDYPLVEHESGRTVCLHVSVLEPDSREVTAVG